MALATFIIVLLILVLLLVSGHLTL